MLLQCRLVRSTPSYGVSAKKLPNLVPKINNLAYNNTILHTPGYRSPTLIAHGDDDQIVPIGASAMLSYRLVKGATLKVYQGLSHGLAQINADVFSADLLAFIKGQSSQVGEARGFLTVADPCFKPVR